MMDGSLGEYFSQKCNNLILMHLVAAFAVIYVHVSAVTGNGPADFFLQLVGYKFIGGIAFDIFFVISGFLVTASALGRNGLLYYVMSRLLRIYPILIICVTLTVFLLGPALTASSTYWSTQQSWSYLWRNTTAFSTEYFLPGMFADAHDKAVNGSLWSLAIELRLYLIVLILAAFGILKNCAVFNLLFFLALVTVYFFSRNMDATISPLKSFARSHEVLDWKLCLDELCCHPDQSCTLVGTSFFFAASQHLTPEFGVAYALLLPYLGFYLTFAPGVAWFNRFGDYSYGVYLYGWIAQQIVLLLNPEMTNTLNVLYSCTLALALATTSWHFGRKTNIAFKGTVQADKLIRQSPFF